VLVVGDELDRAAAGSGRLAGGRDDLKVNGERRLVGQAANLPGRRLADADLGLADAGALLVGRDDVADDARNLELLGRL
jgi:hypothetical protein